MAGVVRAQLTGMGRGVPGHWHLLSGLAQAEGRTGLWTQTTLVGREPSQLRQRGLHVLSTHVVLTEHQVPS